MSATISELFTVEAKKNARPLTTLKQSAVLASIHLSKWMVTRQDKDASRQVADANGNDVTRAKVIKALLDPKRMEAINALDGDIRKYHYERTTGWGEGQARLLGNKGLTEYSAFMADAKIKRQQLVNEFVAGYEQFVREDTAGLGALARSSDYPDPSRIADKFAFTVEYLPVPDSRHFEVLGIDNHIDALKEQLEENTRTAITGVQRELSERIRSVITHLAERLEALGTKEDGKQVRFHASTLTDVAKLADLLPALNVAGDPELDALAAEMRDRLCGYDAEALKTSSAVRNTVETAANDMLAKLDAMMPSFGD